MSRASPVASRCQAAGTSTSYRLDLEQAANATTISAVGKRLGLPDHAITIALTAALQESRLHNLAYGDRDSLGLFQQRPSQGWGSASQVMIPDHAATAFYQRLALVAGWQALPVAEAAQAVQQSAAPDAYGQWETMGRALAVALTGEVPAGLSCRFPPARSLGSGVALSTAMAQELGPPTLGVPVGSARGWTVAAWLVGHAARYRISAVSFGGFRWTPAATTWRADASAGSRVQVAATPAAG